MHVLTMLTMLDVSCCCAVPVRALQSVAACAADYEKFYVPELERKKEQRAQREVDRQRKELDKLQRDMAASTLGPGAAAAAGGAGAGARGRGGMEEEEDDDDDEGFDADAYADEDDDDDE